ncbi:hypothetical protein AWB68_08530 [Caballeronia choica]|uniref:Uncharacterized protein n=1 Tax=Caballeronia choica TaxID=326476 RepID=A0A158L303_9BURK|nr:hypothetical protein [Caballeronia choica]SAL87766.1 hypothetical protein AWB68_08530 [Caballeronia choica]
MEYIVGITLALLFCGAAAGLGMDRERVFYPAVLIAVASYYLAFAVIDGRREVMLSELAIAAIFVAGAVAGFRYNPWIAVVALAGHGVMDGFHHHVVHNIGVPRVWPGFCMTFDVTAAAFVALAMLARARGSERRRASVPAERGRHVIKGAVPP